MPTLEMFTLLTSETDLKYIQKGYLHHMPTLKMFTLLASEADLKYI